MHASPQLSLHLMLSASHFADNTQRCVCVRCCIFDLFVATLTLSPNLFPLRCAHRACVCSLLHFQSHLLTYECSLPISPRSGMHIVRVCVRCRTFDPVALSPLRYAHCAGVCVRCRTFKLQRPLSLPISPPLEFTH